MFKKKKLPTKEERKLFFVAQDGNDQNPGTQSAPLATVEAAIDMSRMCIEPVTIYIRSGRYFIYSTIELSEKDNDTIIAAYEGEEVIFDGGAVIDNKSLSPVSPDAKSRIINKEAAEHILEVNLIPYRLKKGPYGTRGFRRAYQNAPNELFVDGTPYTVTSYPKFSKSPIVFGEDDIAEGGSVPYKCDFSMVPATIKINPEKAYLWRRAENAYISGYFGSSYADDTIKIAKIDPESATITTTLPHIYGFSAGEGRNYRIINLLEEMSEPGEYFVDIANEKLYLYPTKDISKSLIQLSSFDRVIMAIENASNITVKGITFENSRNSGIYIEGGDSVRIENCIFRNLGIMGIQMGCGATQMPEGKHNAHGIRAEDVAVPTNLPRNIGSWHEYLYEYAAWNNKAGKNHVIINCSFTDTGAGGMLLSGGDRKSLDEGSNTVYNCYFARNNRLNRTYCGAINIMGVGNKISHCEIEQLPSVAIYLHGNDHDISYNRIHNVLCEVSDMGAIYMGRDCSEVGNKIHHNFIYNIRSSYRGGYGISAIYFDDHAIYNAVYSNFFYNIISDGTYNFPVVKFNKGGMTSVSNNFFVDCNCNCFPSYPDNGFWVMHNDPLFIKRVFTDDAENFSGVNVTSGEWKRRYPYLAATYKKDYNAGEIFYNNMFANGVEYEHFVDVKKLDFKLADDYADSLRNRKSDAAITDPVMDYKNERVPYSVPDFENIGIIK